MTIATELINDAKSIIKIRKKLMEQQKKLDRQAPKVDVIAPDFILHDVTGENMVTLSDFRGVKPVALVFGSYT
jgi:hypothetical protein